MNETEFKLFLDEHPARSHLTGFSSKKKKDIANRLPATASVEATITISPTSLVVQSTATVVVNKSEWDSITTSIFYNYFEMFSGQPKKHSRNPDD